MHRPVLLKEVMDLLAVKRGGTYVDCTLGGGGHAEALLERIGPQGTLLGLDRDAESLAGVAERLGSWGRSCVLAHANFADLGEVAEEHGIREADGVLADLGMSSIQLDDPQRGFSFQSDGPLDMRMDRTQGPTAAEFLAGVEEQDLMVLLRRWGEEPEARSIAAAIVREREARRIETTAQLAGLVERAKRGRRRKIHPATQTFMALRMAVNCEMESLERGVQAALSLVRPGGRVAVISFHSIEDRAVKHLLARHIGRWESLAAGGTRWLGEEPAVSRVTRKPAMASPEEVAGNPRARSAKLRVVERIR
jgi:16S rRNA (cytosine1402-N4)-methyltransferase